MLKSKPVIPLSDRELQRLYEIKFYLIIRHISLVIHDAGYVYEYLETMSHLARCNASTIKSCAALFQDGSRARVVPTKMELSVMLYRADISIKHIHQLSRLHQNTIYKYLEEFNKDEFEYMPKFNDLQRKEIIKFVQLYESINLSF